MPKPDSFWRLKVAALIHDPAEKALVLLRDPSGHEGGSVSKLFQELNLELSEAELSLVRDSDRWAAAADRPQFPIDESGRYKAWAQVNFTQKPVLKHPLTAQQYEIEGGLWEVGIQDLKDDSFRHFKRCIVRDASGQFVDWKRTYLSLWRKAPERPQEDTQTLGEWWRVLPADTRIPDHTIWEHVRLSSAFCGAMASGGPPALFTFTFGPIQPWIAQARSTSDLWAGSHLLSRICWEGLKVVCEEFGPDAVLYPVLHGVPLVDLWLEAQGIDLSGYGNDWKSIGTDANPLFAAALPNRFVAIVAQEAVEELADRVTSAMRTWVQEKAREAVEALFQKVEWTTGGIEVAKSQAHKQLTGFPEIHWSSAAWEGAKDSERISIKTDKLSHALASFYPDTKADKKPGFFGHPVWRILSRQVLIEGARFYEPNPGVLYPAVYELCDRTLAATKNLRPGAQIIQRGYRCSLCGEREWLTHDLQLLDRPPDKRGTTIWSLLSERHPALAKKGEHLCAPCALKRIWPDLYQKELSQAGIQTTRYVVSTHAMALATTLEKMLEQPGGKNDKHWRKLETSMSKRQDSLFFAALPKTIARKLKKSPERERVLRALPTHFDLLRDKGDEQEIKELNELIKNICGFWPEAYYAMILLDGDDMGVWISGTDSRFLKPYREFWHPDIVQNVRQMEDTVQSENLREYLDSLRAPSPARHAAISGSLNAFALRVGRFVVEDLFKGRLLYAGGDDLMAMASIDDLLGLMETLRCAYSGKEPHASVVHLWEDPGRDRLRKLKNGYGLLDGRLVRLMGEAATVSVGGVIAHHTAPLGSVLRELREAEKRAKQAGKNGFSLSVLKRSGGAVHLTSPWEGPAPQSLPVAVVLSSLRNAFAKDLSRRACYHLLTWLSQLPPTSPDDLLKTLVTYQFHRQRKSKTLNGLQPELRSLAHDLVEISKVGTQENRPNTAFIADALSIAEFLAREGRT